MLQEAKAACRKATGSHNRADRAVAHPERGLTWSRGLVGVMAMNGRSRWRTLDTARVAVNRPTESSSSPAH